MTPIFSGLGTASVRGFGRIFKGPGQFLWDTEVLLSTPGAGNWTKPVNITQVQIECWGAGGGGGNSSVNGAGGGGGGGGGYARSIITYPSASQSIPYVVGASGSGTTWNSNQVLAQGGTQGGTGLSSSEAAEAGKGGGIDFPNIGDVTYIGGNGNVGWSLNVVSSGIEFSSGGGAAGSAGDGGNANINVGPGTGTADFGGTGAIGTPGDVNFTGLTGNIYGGGGSGGQKVSGGQTRLGGLGAQGLIRVRYNSGTLTPEYWWKADSGLSNSAWNSVNGGLNFTLFNVTSATAATGLFLNGSSSYGLTQNISTNIEAKHIFVRTDSISTTPNTTHAILGGTQSTIHEWSFNPSTLENNWFIVENLSTGLTWAAELGQIGSSITWTDLTNYTAPRYFLNTDTTGTDMNVYVGGFNNRLLWESGFGIYVGRRGEDAFVSGYIKEIAIFTTPLTDAAAKTFRAAMAARWP
jgi:hypothetical protein